MSGRGRYYKALYGGRGRGRGGRGGGKLSRQPSAENIVDNKGQKIAREDTIRGTNEDLISNASRLDGKNYPAYHDLFGMWQYPNGLLHIQHIQADPYAPPSRFRLKLEHEVAGFPRNLFSNLVRAVALCDYLTRQLGTTAQQLKRTGGTTQRWSAAKGGDIGVAKPGQQVLQRSAVIIDDSGLEARFTVSLPARGRTILGAEAADILRSHIPALINSVLYSSQDKEHLKRFVDCIEDQETLRSQITDAGLVAFVPNGAILPRASGASDAPLTGMHVVPFQSPPNLENSFTLPHRGVIRGMGIPTGITMIAGGGFHGKSTLLDALSVGCYNHVPGDGREFVATSAKTVSIQGEDGRSITNVNISPFINNLPGGVSTQSFSTQDASGSTSMAAGVIEALELGADTLLFDEDTCATNFLIRDVRMQKLITADPITPLVFKVRAMLREHKCSSVLVIGGCGDYCDVADLVLEMRDYQCHDITQKARQVSQEFPSVVHLHEEKNFGQVSSRVVTPDTLPSANVRVIARKRTSIDVGSESLSLLKLPQLVHDSQTKAIVSALRYCAGVKDRRNISLLLQDLEDVLDRSGLDTLMRGDSTEFFLARPRPFEVGMAINRLRSVSIACNEAI